MPGSSKDLALEATLAHSYTTQRRKATAKAAKAKEKTAREKGKTGKEKGRILPPAPHHPNAADGLKRVLSPIVPLHPADRRPVEIPAHPSAPHEAPLPLDGRMPHHVGNFLQENVIKARNALIGIHQYAAFF